MKKYQVTWGWQPPQYDRPKDNFRLFFHTQEVEREVTRKDFATGEKTTETIREWLCDVVEYEAQEAAEILRLINEGENSVECNRWILNAKITAYDSSDEVNRFFIYEHSTWLDKPTRVGLKLRFEAELAQGMQQTTLWQDGVSFPLPLVGEGNAFDLLNAIELYASACYDNTQKHIAAVRELSTVEELVSYDFRSGYPQKLEFGK